MAVIGLDLGGTKLSCALFSNEGAILYKDIVKLERWEGRGVGELIKNQIIKLMNIGKRKESEIEAIGISIPGISHSTSGRVWAPNIKGWTNYPLLDDIHTIVNQNAIRVKIDSDRSCYILGEVWRGAAKNCSNVIYLGVGTGIGAGILVDGKILKGSNDIAGAIGWLALDRPFLKRYASCGCFEFYASGEGITRRVKELLRKNKMYNGQLKNLNLNNLTTKDIFKELK